MMELAVFLKHLAATHHLAVLLTNHMAAGMASLVVRSIREACVLFLSYILQPIVGSALPLLSAPPTVTSWIQDSHFTEV